MCVTLSKANTNNMKVRLLALFPRIARSWQVSMELTMLFFQALRRSLKNDKERVNHISITPKSAVAIVPPKKVCGRRPTEESPVQC